MKLLDLLVSSYFIKKSKMLLGKAITDNDSANTFIKQHMTSLFPKKGRRTKG